MTLICMISCIDPRKLWYLWADCSCNAATMNGVPAIRASICEQKMDIRQVLERKIFLNIEISSDRSHGARPCWNWIGPTTNGYGPYKRIWQLIAGGSVPEGCDLHHLCHNKACCNPAHLKAVNSGHHSRLHKDKFLVELRDLRLAQLREGIA
jgi:hypothetical protein